MERTCNRTDVLLNKKLLEIGEGKAGMSISVCLATVLMKGEKR